MRVDKSICQKINMEFIEETCARLRADEKVHRRFIGDGVLHIDRQLPFLLLYRLDKEPDLNTAKLIKGEASYFVVPSKLPKSRVALLLHNIIDVLQELHGSFLLLEIWVDPLLNPEDVAPDLMAPSFEIVADTSGELISTCERLSDALIQMRVHRKLVSSNIIYNRKTRPGLKHPLLTKKTLLSLNCYSIGLKIKPIYINQETNELYPLVFRKFHAGLSYAFKHVFYEFSHTILKSSPKHYHALGARAMTKLAYSIDTQLARLSQAVDFLLWVTPINVDQSWKEFKKSKYERIPKLVYKPIPVDPADLKEKLFSIEMQKLHDPTIQTLFEEKRNELDRQLTMLRERNTANFLLSSMQLYGRVEEPLYEIAQSILHSLGTRISDDTFSGKGDAQEFAQIAKEEIRTLCMNQPGLEHPHVIITPEISGLMVNKGDVYVGSSVRVPHNRIHALLQHEVGTHVVSYLNGAQQPVKLFACGLPDYDELQEGLAVLAEYLVGQLSKARMKLLAGRVVGAKLLEEGADLKVIFQTLTDDYYFTPKTAYRIAVRLVRGGGLTKDAIYLRGFCNLIKYLQNGGELELLFLGKFSQDQIPIVEELLMRGILRKPQLLPTYLKDKKAKKRLDKLTKSNSLTETLESMVT